MQIRGPESTRHRRSPHQCTAEEQAYLLKFASQYFETPVTKDDIVWTFSGVRPLYDDGASSASAATRDYVLKVDNSDGQAPVLNIFGGKITTYRKLAESALLEIENALGTKSGPWTKRVPLPGGDFGVYGFDELVENLLNTYDFLTLSWATRMVRMYGTNAAKIIAVVAQTPDTLYKDVKEPNDLGSLLLDQIAHFFENYKDLEAGKWVKVDGWRGSDAARDAVIASVEAAKK